MSAILAKVFNSTVGTKDFKGLDEILRDHKVLVPSEKIYAPILSGSWSGKGANPNAYETLPGKITILTDGVIDLQVSLYLSNVTGIYLRPAINGVPLANIYTAGASSNYDIYNVSNPAWKNITLRKGDVITIMATAAEGATVRQAYICAEVTDKYYARSED